MLKNRLYTIAFISWMSLVAYSCLTSFSGDDVPSFNLPHMDKVVHFGFYFVGAILGTMALRELSKSKIPIKKVLFVILVVVIVFGMIIEVVQEQYTLDREGDMLDVLANSFGAICGALCMKSLFSGKTRLKWEN